MRVHTGLTASGDADALRRAISNAERRECIRLLPDLTRGGRVEMGAPASRASAVLACRPDGGVHNQEHQRERPSPPSDLSHGRVAASLRERRTQRAEWGDWVFWGGVYVLWVVVAYVIAWSVMEGWL